MTNTTTTVTTKTTSTATKAIAAPTTTKTTTGSTIEFVDFSENVYVAKTNDIDFRKAYSKFNAKTNEILETTLDEDLWIKIKYFYTSLGELYFENNTLFFSRSSCGIS